VKNVGRPKTKSEKQTKQCSSCKKNKNIDQYYVSTNQFDADGRTNICKQCVLDNVNVNDIESIKNMLLQLNKPFLLHQWNSSLEEAKRMNRHAFGLYLKSLYLNYRDLTWKDSDQENKNFNQTQILDPIKPITNIQKTEFNITDELIDKWGDGYSPEEYRAFERKYNMLKNNYQEKTAMHTEALLTYIRYRVKEELATANGDSKSAKEWGTLAKDAATAAKINPSQLSKSDLSDGLDTFGQLVRTVEQAVDIIPILPKFKERPQDKVDFTIWCYINYIRDLKGLPPVEYSEIYKFYEERKRDYEQSMTEGEDSDIL
jgi:hypothetical protein